MYRSFAAPFLVLFGCLASIQAASAAGISYRYDSLNRLVSVDYGNGMSIGYTYDAVGNMIRIARGTGGADVIPPVVTAFGLPPESASLVVAVGSFTAQDNVAVTGYCITQSSSPAGCTWSATPPASYSFAPGTGNGWYTLYAFARDAAGNSSSSSAAMVSLALQQQQLAVTIAGLYGGGGSVTSSPAGIACTTGTCNAPFARGTSVTLAPAPDAASVFSTWSGDCSGTGTCTVSMTADRSATATFSLIPRARVGGIPYGTLTSAYAAVPGGGLLEAQALTFIENLVLNRSVAFTLKGGYAADYLGRPGFTSLDGVLTIGSGAVTVDGLIIK